MSRPTDRSLLPKRVLLERFYSWLSDSDFQIQRHLSDG